MYLTIRQVNRKVLRLSIGKNDFGLSIGGALGVKDGVDFAILDALGIGVFDLGDTVHETLLGYVDAFCWGR